MAPPLPPFYHGGMSEAIAALLARRAELAAQLAELEHQAIPIRADIFHLDAALAIMGNGSVPPGSRTGSGAFCSNLAPILCIFRAPSTKKPYATSRVYWRKGKSA